MNLGYLTLLLIPSYFVWQYIKERQQIKMKQVATIAILQGQQIGYANGLQDGYEIGLEQARNNHNRISEN